MKTNTQLTRRKFMAATGIGALAGAALVRLGEPRAQAVSQVPQILTPRTAKPAVIASANGNRSKDAEGLTCVAWAFQMITAEAGVSFTCCTTTRAGKSSGNRGLRFQVVRNSLWLRPSASPSSAIRRATASTALLPATCAPATTISRFFS